jgi:hypothetical protein
MPDLHLVMPEQLTEINLFFESAKELVELGYLINQRAGDTPELAKYLEPRKLNNARQIICYLQYVINKFGEERFKRIFDDSICLVLYKQRHTPNVLNEASNYYIELTKKMIQCPNFSKLGMK